MPDNAQPLSVAGWLMRGAIREDDYASAFGTWAAPNPQDDQDVPRAIWRVMHHFYDPARDRPLTISATCRALYERATGETADFRRSPDWAMGARDAFTDPNTPEAGRRNHYTIFDAREAMYRALTGRNRAGAVVATTKEQRDRYWATTFRALGNIVHHLQDMAQPQHTRNDAHAGVTCFGHESVFEAYIEARATGARSHTIDRQVITPAPLDYLGSTAGYPDGYPLPRVTRYSDFWSTNPGAGSAAGLGLADYSNRAFFTAGKNLGTEEYALPSNNRAAYIPESVEGLLPQFPRQRIHFLRGGSDNIRMTTEGLFDFWFVNTPPSYSLNRFNYDDQAKLLIPRAVAYGAGMIDYFFRGRLEGEDVAFSNTGITLRIKNAIDIQKTPAWSNEVLYASTNGRPSSLIISFDYKDAAGTVHYGVSGPVTMVEGDDIAPGRVSNREYSFSLSLPPGTRDARYRVVFAGRLGQEGAGIAVGAIEPLSGFVVSPPFLPVDGITGPRLIYQSDGLWKLHEKPGMVAGNIDWKGPNRNGQTTVLTWEGPPTRYFPGGQFTPNVYRNGEIFAVAPHLVLGAAIHRDATGRQWLVVICKDGMRDVVYRRPDRKSNSPTLYDPVTNPEGWQVIGDFAHASPTFEEADTPWFFNESGNEAQTMRRGYKWGLVHEVWLYRLKIVIADGAAQLTNEDNLPGFTHRQLEAKSCIEDSMSDSDAVCTGACGGVRKAATYIQKIHTETFTATGDFIVAVDYQGDFPVLATASLNRRNVDTYTRTIDHEQWSVCGRDDRGYVYGCDDPRNRWVDRGETSTRLEFDESVTLSFPGISPLRVRSQTGSRFMVITSADNAVTGQSTYRREINSLQHLDLRYGMYAIHTEAFDEAMTGPGRRTGLDNNLLLGPLRRTSQNNQHIRTARETIPVIHNEATTTTALILPLYDSYIDNRLQCGETRVQDIGVYVLDYEELPRIVSDDASSWAIDSRGNVFASQRTVDASGVFTGVFNFLQGGNLRQIIPPAPDGALYNARVVR